MARFEVAGLSDGFRGLSSAGSQTDNQFASLANPIPDLLSYIYDDESSSAAKMQPVFNPSQPDADLNTDVIGLNVATVVLGSSRSDIASDVEAEIGTSVGGNPGDLVTFRIVAEDGELDGQAVDVTVLAVGQVHFPLPGANNDAFGRYEVHYFGPSGDQVLLAGQHSGGAGDSGVQTRDVTFRSAIGQTVLISLYARSQVSVDRRLSQSAGAGAGVSLKLVVVPPPPPGDTPTPPGDTPTPPGDTPTPPGDTPTPPGDTPTPPGVPTGPHSYELKDGSVRVPARIAANVDRMADTFFAATGIHLTLTDGERTFEEQAKQMYDKLLLGVKAYKKIYRNGPKAKAVQKAYNSASTPDARIQAMTVAIQALFNNKEYVSKHLTNNAVDVRTEGLAKKQLKALDKAIASAGGKVDRNEPGPPHAHVTFD